MIEVPFRAIVQAYPLQICRYLFYSYCPLRYRAEEVHYTNPLFLTFYFAEKRRFCNIWCSYILTCVWLAYNATPLLRSQPKRILPLWLRRQPKGSALLFPPVHGHARYPAALSSGLLRVHTPALAASFCGAHHCFAGLLQKWRAKTGGTSHEAVEAG